LLALSLTSTLVIAGVWLCVDYFRLDPVQHYSAEGWYAVWPFGMYAVGALLAIVLLGSFLWSGCTALIRGVQRRAGMISEEC
jgi:hypothetical protein